MSDEPQTHRTRDMRVPLIVQPRNRRSEEIGMIAGALAAAQGEMTAAKKDSDNPYYKSRYADLASVWEACREALSKHELSVIQLPSWDGKRVEVETLLSHSSGQWFSDVLHMVPGWTDKEDNFHPLLDAQAVGAAITYARRYALSAMVGIASEDDDGNEAAGADRENSRQSDEQQGGTLTAEPVPGKYWSIKRQHGQRAADEFLGQAFDGAKVTARKTPEGWRVVVLEGSPPEGVMIPADKPGSWKDVICHIGKAAGPIKNRRLGTIDDKSLEWIQSTLRAKGPKASREDKRVLAALALWEEEKRLGDELPMGDGHTSTAAGATGANLEILRQNLEFANLTDLSLFLRVANREGWTRAQSMEAITDEEAGRMVDSFATVEARYLEDIELEGNRGA